MIGAEISKKQLVPLSATFAAVYGVLRLVPISTWLGLSGRVFTATEFVAPLLGIILGPYAGSVASVVGTFLGIALTGRMNFFGLDFVPVMANALVLGFLVQRRRTLSILIYSGLLVLFFALPSTMHFVSIPLPTGEVVLPFVWLHILAWLILLSPLSKKSVEWISSAAVPRAILAACVLTLIGTTAQHLTGTLLFAGMAVPLMGMTPQTLASTWVAVFYVYPVERSMIVLGATTVTLALVKTLKAASLLRMDADMRSVSKSKSQSGNDAKQM